ncbi:hypothetical protein F0562_009050 [Nyssa sinensis]|uniref:Uncharacterized protein n=1 Tax=Nyssa sinensis TaxID=561372 RepID=A0A5J5ABM7_9ASTE|nr:hypothetical protein F0562_009050 [Nyssa sinensis]
MASVWVCSETKSAFVTRVFVIQIRRGRGASAQWFPTLVRDDWDRKSLRGDVVNGSDGGGKSLGFGRAGRSVSSWLVAGGNNRDFSNGGSG